MPAASPKPPPRSRDTISILGWAASQAASIMRAAGVSKTAVRRWQARFMDEGVLGQLRVKTRPRGFQSWPTADYDEASRVNRTCAPQGDLLAGPSSALDVPLHAAASWLNAVEGFLAILTKRRLKRGVFRGVVDLQAAFNRFVADHNQLRRSPSSGPPILTRSSPLQREGTKCWNQSASLGLWHCASPTNHRAECPLSD